MDNAFYFLNRSIDEFDSDIKYSIIHFCIALENILKAELLHEHWALIFKKPENANWTDFIDGNFQSVSLEESISRLRKISGREIEESAHKYFMDISKERNKIIHFYNNNISKEKIANSQFNAWYYVDKFLRTWHNHFYGFEDSKRKFRVIMSKHLGYLAVKYDKIKSNLEKLDKTKLFLNTCSHCNYNAIVIPNIELNLTTAKCRVCDHIFNGITIVCPDCGKLTFITDEHSILCGCQPNFDSGKLIKLIETNFGYYSDVKHGEEIDWLANCTCCDGYQTVIKLNDDLWFCTECFTAFDKISCCEWCNELYTGESEDTYIHGCGCNFCGGYIAHQKDD